MSGTPPPHNRHNSSMNTITTSACNGLSTVTRPSTNVMSARRTTTGCLTCRVRKKKCDEVRPSCTGCRRNAILCHWQELRSKRRPQFLRRQGYNKDFAVPGQMTGMMSVFAAPSTSLTDELISHFIKSSPNWIASVNSRQGACFLSHVMPSALRSTLVLDCVLTVAAGDLCKTGDRSKELEQLSYEYYGRAAAALSLTISREVKDIQAGIEDCSSDTTLLAVLLLCVHETINFSSSDRLLTHINGAALLLSHSLFCTPNDPDLRGFLLELFCYFYTLASSTHGSHMSLDISFTSAIFKSPWFKGHQSQGMLLGNSPEVFLIILRLSASLHQASAAQCGVETLHQQLLTIQTDLWQYFVDHIAMTPEESNSDPGSWVSELYFLACQVQVEMALHLNWPQENGTIQILVSAFMSVLEMVPTNSPANGVLCWPLFIVGLCALSGKHQATISARFKAIYSGWRSSIPLQSFKYLCQRWKGEKSRNVATVPSSPVDVVTDPRLLDLPMILV